MGEDVDRVQGVVHLALGLTQHLHTALYVSYDHLSWLI